MRPTTLRARRGAALVLSCEHASYALPAGYAGLGLEPEQVREHIGWDIGAAALTQQLSETLDVPAVLSSVSRLLVDCNRDEAAHDLIPESSDGVSIPGNLGIEAGERNARLRSFYVPYHDEVDRQMRASGAGFLLSVHSFAPRMNGRERNFDVGVLYDDFEDVATRLGEGLQAAGFGVRLNEPYSGFEGLIHSAQRHGTSNGAHYLEIELNNALLGNEAETGAIARRIAPAITAIVDSLPRRV